MKRFKTPTATLANRLKNAGTFDVSLSFKCSIPRIAYLSQGLALTGLYGYNQNLQTTYPVEPSMLPQLLAFEDMSRKYFMIYRAYNVVHFVYVCNTM